MQLGPNPLGIIATIGLALLMMGYLASKWNTTKREKEK